MPAVSVREAGVADHPVLERLWLMFRHDMSQEVVARHPGRWEVAFQDENVAAVRFWRRVATEIAGDAWTEDRRPVPGQPRLPPDVWISFDVPADARAWAG